MTWTTQQQQAIDERGKNILVAAAAGSGKTAVLVERIKKQVTEEGVSIDNMLIVTFTNAAASEMREKIRKAIRAKAKEVPELKKQLDLLPGASISTFHAFALDVIKHFFYLIDLEPGFSICDDAQSVVIKEDAIDELIESRFEEDSEEFYEFLDWYGSEHDLDKVKSIINRTYTALQALPEPFETFDKKVAELSLTPDEYKRTRAMALMDDIVFFDLLDALNYLEEAERLISSSGLTNMAKKIRPEIEAHKSMLEMAESGNYDAIGVIMEAFPKVVMRTSGLERESYAEISDIVKALRNNAKALRNDLQSAFFTAPMIGQFNDINDLSDKAKTLQGLLIDFDRIFKEKKAEKGLIDFNDIEHYCLEILSDPRAAEYYRDKYSYIFIDEYQDTSLLQEAIIDRIKREDNLFMVGDIKQSIYKFRLAEPEIFKRKYNDFAKCTDGKSIKIDLNRNFRSKPAILSGINRLFGPIMEDYNNDAKLYPGIEYEGKYSFEPECVVIDMSTLDEADEAVQELESDELEALEICSIIKENLGKEYYDSKKCQVRKIEYRDIVILMRSVKSHADTYYQVLKAQGIPLFVDDNDGYFDTMEINIFMNLLSVLDNKYQDVPFISVLRSEIFGFSTDELARIRACHKKDSYVTAFRIFAEEQDDMADLQKKCRSVFDKLERWKGLAMAMPLPKFIWKLMLESGYYIIMGAMPSGTQRQANLRALVDKAENFANSGQTSLYSFMQYIDMVKKNDIKTGQVKLLGEKDDVVRLMTIHKSKGLEFPMVIVSGMSRKLMYGKSDEKVLFHKDVGLGMFKEDPKQHLENKTLPYNIIMRQVHREEYEEQIRVLYVALTRARDILYMTGTVRDALKFMRGKEIGVRSDSTYFNLLSILPPCDIISCSELKLPDDEDALKRGVISDMLAGAPDEELAQKVKAKLDYEYPFEYARKIRPKYSVSSLNAASHGRTSAAASGEIHLTEPAFMQENKAMTGAEKGTVYHGIMERLDFSRAQKEGRKYIESMAEAFVRDGIFLQNEIEAVDFERIERFFGSEMGQRCVRAFEGGRLRREEPFDLKLQMDGEDIVVQGIIDCYFEENGKIILLDYKTNWIDESKPFEEEEKRLRDTYKTQLEKYGEALTKASGKPVTESYLYLFSAGRLIEVN